MVCLLQHYLQSGFISVIFAGNTYENGWTDEKYPVIYTRIDCSSTNTRLRSCSSSVSSSIQYCSNKQIVKLKCGGKYYVIQRAKELDINDSEKKFSTFIHGS